MQIQLKPLSEQAVVVFGASSGIGRLTALRLAAKGAKVMVAARNEAGLKGLVEEIRALGGTAEYTVADAVDFEQVKAVADRAAGFFGRLDTWIHAAGVYLVAPFEKTTPEEFRHIIDVNLNGQAYGAMAALPHLRRAGGGALIHVSSVEARRALPMQGAYAASKHGIVGFLDALRLELLNENVPISVTNLMPASINTRLFATAKTKIGVKPRGIPPYYQPEVVADAILFAAQNPVRDLYAGGMGKVLVAAHQLSPGLVDAYLLKFGFEQSRTDEPKSVDSPNSFETTVDDRRIEGEFGGEARKRSLLTELDTRPALKRALWGVALGLLGLFAWQRSSRPALRA